MVITDKKDGIEIKMSIDEKCNLIRYVENISINELISIAPVGICNESRVVLRLLFTEIFNTLFAKYNNRKKRGKANPL